MIIKEFDQTPVKSPQLHVKSNLTLRRAKWNKQFVNKFDEENHMKLHMSQEGGGATGG